MMEGQARRKAILLIILFGLTTALIFWAILQLRFTPENKYQLAVGEISPRDIRAPFAVSYESEVLTQQARDLRAATVPRVYDPLDRQVGRRQIQKAQEILHFLDIVRIEPYASLAEKAAWIKTLQDLTLSDEAIAAILSLDENAWNTIRQETLRVLEQAMAGEIKEGEEDLVRSTVPAMVSYALDETQTLVVVELVQGLIQPNRRYNPEATEAERQKARKAVSPIHVDIEENELIVREGEPITEETMEKLIHLGLQQPASSPWRGRIADAVLATLLSTLLSIHLVIFAPDQITPRRLGLLLALLTLFTLAAKLMVPGHTVLPYLLPAATLTMLLGTLLNVHTAIIGNIILALIGGYIGGGWLEIAIYFLSAGLLALPFVRRVVRLNTFIWAGGVIALSNIAVVLTFRLPDLQTDMLGLGTLLGASLVNGALATSIAMGGYYLLGTLLDLTTPLQLLDLARPTHPLLQQLLLKAPGTYHHSILVGNMAEQAAGRIGADPLLARVGAFYHDIGKIKRPYFFIENQVEGSNPHDQLDPETSAQIITRHVEDGLELARKYRLPRQVRAFITEHHGTATADYFYHRAQQANSHIDEHVFHYPGPRPRSKETAIVMLADACEAAVRAARPSSAEEIEQIIDKIIRDRLISGQLDESNLTMHDLHIIRQSFQEILKGVFHPRVQYDLESNPTPTEEHGERHDPIRDRSPDQSSLATHHPR